MKWLTDYTFKDFFNDLFIDTKTTITVIVLFIILITMIVILAYSIVSSKRVKYSNIQLGLKKYIKLLQKQNNRKHSNITLKEFDEIMSFIKDVEIRNLTFKEHEDLEILKLQLSLLRVEYENKDLFKY